MFNLLFWVFIVKFHKDTILEVLSLQICFPVHGTVEETLKAEVPHDVFGIFLIEKVSFEGLGKIIHQRFELIKSTLSLHCGIHRCDFAMEHCEILVVCINALMKKLGVFLLKLGSMRLTVCYSLTCLFSGFSWSVNCIRVLEYDI